MKRVFFLLVGFALVMSMGCVYRYNSGNVQVETNDPRRGGDVVNHTAPVPQLPEEVGNALDRNPYASVYHRENESTTIYNGQRNGNGMADMYTTCDLENPHPTPARWSFVEAGTGASESMTVPRNTVGHIKFMPGVYRYQVYTVTGSNAPAYTASGTVEVLPSGDRNRYSNMMGQWRDCVLTYQHP